MAACSLQRAACSSQLGLPVSSQFSKDTSRDGIAHLLEPLQATINSIPALAIWVKRTSLEWVYSLITRPDPCLIDPYYKAPRSVRTVLNHFPLLHDTHAWLQPRKQGSAVTTGKIWGLIEVWSPKLKNAMYSCRICQPNCVVLSQILDYSPNPLPKKTT